MALVNCPECGKANVSDTAESCPECGYSIKKHFEREKEKAYYKKKENEEWEKVQAELNKELELVDELKPFPKPIKPSKLKHMFYFNDNLSLLSWALICCVVSFLLCFVFTGIFSVLTALLIVIGIPVAAYITYVDYDIMYNCYKRDYDIWLEQQNDWDGYIKKKKAAVEKKYRDIASNMAHYGSESVPSYPSQNDNNKLKCPVCGSTNVNRISTLDRSVSIATVGLASGKIGKQYKCKNCKHVW